MKKGKRLTALLLALVIVLGLAACGGKDDEDDGQQLTGTVYVPEFVNLKSDDMDLDYLAGGCCDGENVYLLGEKSVEEEIKNEAGEVVDYTNYSTYKIYKISLETKEISELENYEPAMNDDHSDYKTDVYVDIQGLETGADGTLWVNESCSKYTYNLPEDFDPMTQSKWEFESTYERIALRRQLDTTGSEIARVDESDLLKKLEVGYLDSSVRDGQGNTYAMTSTWDEETEKNIVKISVLDKDLNILFTLETDQWGELVQLSDSQVGMRAYTEDGNLIRLIDLTSKDWGKKYRMSDRGGRIYKGSGDYLFYLNIGDALYGCTQANLDAAEVKETDDAAAAADAEKTTLTGERLFSWSSADINQDNLQFFDFLPDGRVAAMTNEWGGKDVGQIMELAVLTPTDASTLPPRTTLTYACLYCDYDVRAQIIKFNRASTGSRIEIKDYSEYITDSGEGYEDSYQAAITKLNAEIIAGNVPDLIQTDSLPFARYAGQGVLEDLWPYIDNDPDLGRDKLMIRPLEAAQTNGKLFQIFSSFSIRTAAGATRAVGDRMSWTLKEMQEALANMPEGCTYFGEGDTKDGMLQQVMAQSLDRFVDWETGKCSFDSPDFISVLEFCNSFPLEFDYNDYDWESQPSMYEKLRNGMQMLLTQSISDMDDITYLDALFGGECSFVGYPTESGVGSSFQVQGGMAMSSTCKDKDAAWSFMRQMLLPAEDGRYGYNRFGGWGFPINKENFDKQMERDMKVEYETDENGNPILDENGNPIEITHGTWWISDDVQIEMKAVTQAQYDKFMALYNAIDTIYSYDTEIFTAVSEVAAPYFNGDATVEETARKIQGRVDLYVNEQR